ncbi:MAG: ABC transporter permease, partial [Geminicoccaceae bacterium]
MPDRRRNGHRALGLPHSTEGWLIWVILVLVAFLALTTDTFFTLTNFFDLLNGSSVNLIFAVGLLVVLIAGGIDISFAVAASVVQYLTAVTVMQ